MLDLYASVLQRALRVVYCCCNRNTARYCTPKLPLVCNDACSVRATTSSCSIHTLQSTLSYREKLIRVWNHAVMRRTRCAFIHSADTLGTSCNHIAQLLLAQCLLLVSRVCSELLCRAADLTMLLHSSMLYQAPVSQHFVRCAVTPYQAVVSTHHY
jgi:hypothetical protein